MNQARRRITAAIAAASLVPAFAQRGYATLIVPYGSGGNIDTTARLLAEHLRGVLGQSVIVENKTGAGGAIGITALTQSAPDGNTFLIGGVGTHLLPLMNKTVTYDPDKQLRPVALISAAPLLLVVRSDSPYRTLSDLLEAGKHKSLNFGSSGMGTTPHLAAEWLMAVTSTPAVHIPYRGGSALTQAVLAGDVDFVIDPVLSTAPFVKAGKLRALGVTVPGKIPGLPDVPAISDTVAGYSVTSWLGFYLPASTPDAAAARLESALKAVVDEPNVQAKLLEMGNRPSFKGSAEFQRFIGDETTRYGKLIAQQNIRTQ